MSDNKNDEDPYKDPVFYYSRERRLKRASQRVQALYDGKSIRPSLSKSLFATKGNVLVFISIFLVFAFVMGNRFSGRAREQGIRFGGNNLAVTVFSIEETQFLGIVKTIPASGEFYTGPVDIAVSPVLPRSKEGEEQPLPKIYTHRVVFSSIESETYRLSLPFEGNDFLVLFSTEHEQRSVRLRANS